MEDTNLPKREIENLFDLDSTFQALIEAHLGADFKSVTSELGEMGLNAALATKHSDNADHFGPRLIPYNPQGQKVNQVEYHPSYRKLEELSYGAGLVSKKYEKNRTGVYKTHRQTATFAKGYLFSQTETGLTCPICMTDAIGKVLELYGKQIPEAQEVLRRLASTDVDEIWQGAMFMTERQGGSDVGANTVVASEQNGEWFLNGHKWFCSNVDSGAILALARMPDAGPGTKGLGLFLVLRDMPENNFKTWDVHRLKEKLGVRAMASGEVTFRNTKATLIGGANEGFKMMTDMVNMSRLWNSIASVGISRRAVLEAKLWGQERKAFGKRLTDQPLWRSCISDLHSEHLMMLTLVFEICAQLDKGEKGDAEAMKCVRSMTPLAKALTGKLAVFAAAEGMELIGGNAYIEEDIMPRLYRDAQVLPIWEGTTQIQSLDLLRVIKKEGPDAIFLRAFTALQKVDQIPELKTIALDIEQRLKALKEFMKSFDGEDVENLQRASRSFLEMAGRSLAQALMIEKAAQSEKLKPVYVAALKRLVERPFATAPLGVAFQPESLVDEQLLIDSI
jgi:acyl-CoA dehydrogenase